MDVVSAEFSKLLLQLLEDIENLTEIQLVWKIFAGIRIGCNNWKGMDFEYGYLKLGEIVFLNRVDKEIRNCPCDVEFSRVHNPSREIWFSRPYGVILEYLLQILVYNIFSPLKLA